MTEKLTKREGGGRKAASRAMDRSAVWTRKGFVFSVTPAPRPQTDADMETSVNIWRKEIAYSYIKTQALATVRLKQIRDSNKSVFKANPCWNKSVSKQICDGANPCRNKSVSKQICDGANLYTNKSVQQICIRTNLYNKSVIPTNLYEQICIDKSVLQRKICASTNL